MTKDAMPMAWNEPGGNRRGPWGNNNNDGPPDIDQALRNLRNKFFGAFGGSGGGDSNSSNKVLVTLLLIVVGVVYVLSGFYIVRPAEQAVVTRFGEYNRTVGSGPHWLPRFIESKQIVNSEKVGYSRHSGSMLTRDENIVFVEIEVQYRISDVNNFLFKVVDPIKAMRQAAESALRQVVGHSDLDFIMTEGRAQIAEEVREYITLLLDRYNAGVHILAVAFKEAKAPEAVKSAFDDVIKAREEQERLKHAAEAFANKIVPEAQGQAKKMLVEAQAYEQQVIARSKGDAARFDAILSEYNKAPEVTKKRLYLETLEEVLGNTNKILVDVAGGNNLIYLPVDKLMNISKTDNEELPQLSSIAKEEQIPVVEDISSRARRRRG